MRAQALFRPLVVAMITTTAMALGGCGGGGDDAPPPPPAPPPCAAPCVGASGGTVSGPAGAGVSVPAGAIANNVTVAITQNATPPAPVPGQFAAAGPVFAFEPHGQTFAQPVTITVPFEPAALGEDTPQLLRLAQGGSAWAPVANAVRSGSAMTAQVSSFSWFAVAKAVAAPAIATQPANASVVAGQTATFSVTATGGGTLSYQWLRNGAAISGATSASYTTPALALTDNGAKFSVTVSNSAGSATSNEATLTVAAPVPARVDLLGQANLSPQFTLLPWSTTDRAHLIDAKGVRRTVNFSADGTFRFDDIGDLTAPLYIVTSDQNDSMYGIETVLRDKLTATRTIYLNALTSYIATAALGRNQQISETLVVATATAQQLTPSNIDAALAKYRVTFGPLVTAVGGDAASFDPALSSQSPQVDDMVQVNGADSAGLSRWINGHAQIPAATGIQMILLGQPLPAPVSVDAGFVKPLLAALDACFKLPVAQRADVNGSGFITQVKGACATMPVSPTYSNNLASAAARYADWLLDPRTEGANFGAFLHAKDGPTVAVFALYFTNFATGFHDLKIDVMRKTGATWQLTGNQRKYEAFVSTEFVRSEHLNPDPSPINSIFRLSRIDTVLNFRFDPSNGTDAAGVRAIRIKGRGIPAAGLVYTRSTSCNRADRLVVHNKVGDVNVSASPSRTTYFYLQSVPLVAGGTEGPWTPADAAFADQELDNAALNAFGILEPYTVEVFKTGDTTTPSDTFVMRLGSPPRLGARSFAWPTISAGTRQYLNPAAPQAVATASLPMAWTQPGTTLPGPNLVYTSTRGQVDGAERRVFDSLTFVPGSRTDALFGPNNVPPGETNPCTATSFPALAIEPNNVRSFGLLTNYWGARYTTEFLYLTF